jgi:MYXO-CTERM domain-containing protein
MYCRRIVFPILMLAAALHASTINFNAFPGPDNTLGTADDVPVNATSSAAVQFTTQFSQLAGGTGVLFDSLNPVNLGVGAITKIGSTYILVDARPDVSSTAYSFADVGMRFVSSADGSTPVTVGEVTLTLFSGGFGNQNVTFYDLAGNALITDTVSPGSTVSYSNPSGIAKVTAHTTGSIGVTSLEFTPASVPEPAGELLAGLGLVGIGLVRRRRRIGRAILPILALAVLWTAPRLSADTLWFNATADAAAPAGQWDPNGMFKYSFQTNSAPLPQDLHPDTSAEDAGESPEPSLLVAAGPALAIALAGAAIALRKEHYVED